MGDVDELLLEYMDRGMSEAQARALCGLPPRPVKVVPEDSAIEFDGGKELGYSESLEAGVTEAVMALRRIMASGKSDAAVVSAANAVLDRAKGKAVQTNIVNRNTTYTIVSEIGAAPNSVGKKLDVIDIEE